MKRYAIAGASARGLGMFARPMLDSYGATARLVGVFDPNEARASYVSAQSGGAPVFTDFDELLRVTQPECVIVTTVDRYHHEYIIRALDAGCDAITEKPMTIDAEKCRAIWEAERRTGRQVIVTFNMRFSPYVTRIKSLLRGGTIGRVLNVHLEWFLDTSHGADYFRRWHRRKENSGGLLVHKATHHFDMVNWCLDDEPAVVSAFGACQVYGPTRQERGVRCSSCAYTDTCEFYVDYRADEALNNLYFQAEHLDGYYRDGCVFSDEVDIEDTMTVAVRYGGGAQLSYSLVAYSPYEGWRMTLTGDQGRMEVGEVFSGPRSTEPGNTITIHHAGGETITHMVPKTLGVHGGSDDLLRERLFGPYVRPDPLGYMAGSRAGAMALLIGVAANTSMTTGQPVAIGDLL